MNKRRRDGTDTALLDLWRPPAEAGDASGCLATTYTFDAELYDRYCLGAFLGIDSDPEREDLAYLLERESRLAACYAGVLVDETHAGVSHSLRWDVLPVKVPGAIQHAKLTILAWANHVRAIIASANLTEAGYRLNREVVAVVEYTPKECDHALLANKLNFLEEMLRYVPGREDGPPHIERARSFLREVARRTRDWTGAPSRKPAQRVFVSTMPSRPRFPGSGTLRAAAEVMGRSRRPIGQVRIASPFFDKEGADVTFGAICDVLGPRSFPALWLAAPADQLEAANVPARLRAPREVVKAVEDRGVYLELDALPDKDSEDVNRVWHAKLLQFDTGDLLGLVIGSSNCTRAGLGIGNRSNFEANLLYLVDLGERRTIRELGTIWDGMITIKRVEDVEWLESLDDPGEEAGAVPLPAGFVEALFEGGTPHAFHLTLDPARLPPEWAVLGETPTPHPILDHSGLAIKGEELFTTTVPWESERPPTRLRVTWGDGQAADWPFNVTDPAAVPPPPELSGLTADEMLRMLATSDPGAAARAWAARKGSDAEFDPELDSTTAFDLDPLRRYRLGDTFLHKVRARARLFAHYQKQLGRAAWTSQALEARLTGLLSAQALVQRFERECVATGADPSEAVLALGDLLLALSEIRYEPTEGALSRAAFESRFRPFLGSLATELDGRLADILTASSPDIQEFWNGILGRCGGAA
ncbi:MAG: hypothetical protein ABR602_11055 [Gemmatimonadales bacterium]